MISNNDKNIEIKNISYNDETDLFIINKKYNNELEKFKNISPTFLIHNKKNYFFSYNPIMNCKSAGIIPYTFINNQLYFLLQHSITPITKKNNGWNDFGGKKININETTYDIASREFNEETSCLFYLKEINNEDNNNNYNLIKNNIENIIDKNYINIIKNILPISNKYFSEKIKEKNLYVSSKEIYISYFIKVQYIPSEDLPKSEDIHIDYKFRYLRECKWFSYEEIILFNEKNIHKRLQITKLQERIKKFYKKRLFN